MNIFKIFIPKDNAQEINELESWTVTWNVLSGWSGSVKVHSKVFVDKKHAKEFEKQLKESAKFIKAPINTEIKTN